MNYTHKKTGKTYFKRLCSNASQASGRQVAARVRSGDHQSRGWRIPSAATPTPFLTDANAVSHRQVGRGRAPEGASWTGCQHEFDNPTSEDAVWYGSFF